MRRVLQPTTRIVGEIERPDEREHKTAKARSGDYGLDIQRAALSVLSKYPTQAALSWATDHIRQIVDGPIAPLRVEFPDPQRTAQHIKDLALFFRADEVGVCEVPPFAVYTHDAAGQTAELSHKYAIAILVDQDYRTMRGSTGMDMIVAAQAQRSYAHAGYIAVQLARYIRSLGYSARAQIVGRYQVAVVPILLFAGLGEIGRAGILVNPRLGMRFKASVVTTDLPMAADQPVDFALQSFCEQCKKCATYCPSKAIPTGSKTVYNGYETWATDHEKCLYFRLANKAGSACSRCIKVCPWNRPDVAHHRFGMWVAERSGIGQKLLIWIDQALKSNLKAVKEDRWWPLEDIAPDFRATWQPLVDVAPKGVPIAARGAEMDEHGTKRLQGLCLPAGYPGGKVEQGEGSDAGRGHQANALPF